MAGAKNAHTMIPLNPIEMMKVGDTALYERAKDGEVGTYEIEEIFDHGADPKQRVVVTRKVFPLNENLRQRTIFNARAQGGSVDLYRPCCALPENIDSVVETQQRRNREREQA